jgi:hypothetical protein
MSDSTESLVGLLTFYEKANFALRLALFIAVLWPFSVIGTAMALDPATAQTVVPIVDLIPLAAVFFLVIGAPFGLIVLLRDPTARRGLTWLAGCIGVELTIGVYFSTVPVSKDIGLVPLLILTAFAILFLRIGGLAGFLTKTLVLLIVGITVVFLLGGRERFENKLENALSPPPSVPDIQQPLKEPTPRRSVATATPTPIPTTDSEHPEPATPPPIYSGPVAATKDADVFHFGFWPCRRAAAATFCVGFLENESEQDAYRGVLPSDVKDDLGNDYAFESFTINGFSCFGRRGGCWPDVGPKDSQEIKFQVDGVVPQATSLVLFIHLTTHGSPFAQPPGFDNTQAQDFTVTVPLGKGR